MKDNILKECLKKCEPILDESMFRVLHTYTISLSEEVRKRENYDPDYDYTVVINLAKEEMQKSCNRIIDETYEYFRKIGSL